MAERPVILADADNTLWDTDAVFAKAQSIMLDAVEKERGSSAPADDRLGWLRRFDQALAKCDHRHLRYPPRLLVHALALGLQGTDPTEAAAVSVAGRAKTLSNDAVDAIVGEYLARLHDLPDLLPGVRDGLAAARNAGVEVWVLSEGVADRQRARVAEHGISDLINGLAEVTKTVEQFDRQRRRFAPRPLYVVGDQPDRDIAPARAAGCRTVLVPSRFRPHWHDDGAWGDADHVTEDFDEGVSWILDDASASAGIAAE
jgi:putative hydrolase of the HAD superfamily